VARRNAIADGAGLLAFTIIGVLTHGSSFTAFVRDLLLFLGCWFAAALAVKLYRRPSWRRLLATWLVSVSAAVLIRAAIVGHFAGDFYGVALAFTLLFVLAARKASDLVATWSRLGRSL
jgi:glucose-6-phosphate-specific signal transduction histidine kinase